MLAVWAAPAAAQPNTVRYRPAEKDLKFVALDSGFTVKIHLVEMVDPNYVVIAAIDKRYLPVKR
jgi:hypothetical protein